MKAKITLTPILQVERQDSSFIPQPQASSQPRRTLKLCPNHHKTCQLICLHDHLPVCTDCAIFGQHKTHEFKTMCEFDKDRLKRMEELAQLMDTFNNIGGKIDSSEHENSLLKEVQLLRESIKKNFGLLREYIELVETKALEDATVFLQSARQKILQNHEIPPFLKKQADQWQAEALHQCGTLQNQSDLTNQATFLYTLAPALFDKGHRFVRHIQKQKSDIEKQLKAITKSIKVTFDYQILDQFQNFSKVYVFDENKGDEALLDGISMENNENHSGSDEDKEKILRNLDCPSIKANSEKNFSESDFEELIDSNNKDLDSIDSNNSSFVSVKTVNIGSVKPKPKKQPPKRLNIFKLPERYEAIFQILKKDQLELVDLTNAELGDDVILRFSEQVDNSKVKIVKFIRNKLSDEIIPRILPYLSSVITLNLAQNYLTERTLDYILDNLQKLPKLKSVILSQNKIKQRNVKERLKEFSSKNVVVSL